MSSAPDIRNNGERPQYAALCWRLRQGVPEVLLITSRDTGRWVIPKGWPMKGLEPHEAAAREAWEEAGVTGKVDPVCLGVYGYAKQMGPERSVPCVVAVHLLRVTEVAEDFPEVGQRERRWLPPARAAKKVDEPELRALLADFSPRGVSGKGKSTGKRRVNLVSAVEKPRAKVAKTSE